MADSQQDRNPSYGIFGLNSPGAQPAGSTEQGQTYAPGPGQPIYVQVPSPPARGGMGGAVIFWLGLVLLGVSGVNLYLGITTRKQLNETASKHADQLDLLTRRMNSSEERYAQLRGQFQVTTDRLGLTQQELARARNLAGNIQKEQQQAVQQLSAAISAKASTDQVDKLQAEATTKFGALSSDITGTQKDLDATKEALRAAKGELTGAIARTHDELVALARRSDRDYFEFNLAQKGAKQKVGTVTIELRKTDTKKNLYTVSLYFDDKRAERKDKAINEPVYFLIQGASSAVELVVNKLGKNSVGGYLSAPKGLFQNTPNVLAARPGA